MVALPRTMPAESMLSSMPMSENASQVSVGAAALLIMSEERAKQLGLQPLEVQRPLGQRLLRQGELVVPGLVPITGRLVPGLPLGLVRARV